MRLMKLKNFFWILGLAFILLLGWCKKGDKIGDIYQVQEMKYVVKTWIMISENSFVWTVEPQSQTMLWSPVGGKIVSIKVDEGDYVKWWWLLAEVDPSPIMTNLKSANDILATLEAMYKNTEAMFDAQIAAMKQKVQQAKAAMEMAQKALEWVNKWLKDTHKITKEQLETAKKQVEQAKVWVETAKTNLEHTKKVLKQREKDIYSNSKNALAQARIVATNFLNFVDELVWISDKNKHKNDMFEAYLGAKNTALKENIKSERRKVYSDYKSWKKDVDQLIEDIKNSPDVTADEKLKQRIYNALKQTEGLFVKLRKLADDTYHLIDASVAAPTFPASMINQYKQQATNFQTMIEKTLLTAEWNYLLGIKWSIQAIENFKKQSKMKLDLLQKQYEMAQKQYETAKQTYQQYLAMSQWKIDEVTTKKQVTEKQYEIAKKQYEEAVAGLKALQKQKATQLSQIKSKIAQVKWNRSQAAIQLGYTKIVAPYDGIILKKMADIGQVVGPGMPVFALADDKKLKIKVYLPSSLANKIKVGDKVRIYITDLWEFFTGFVHKIYPNVDFMSKRIPIEVYLENIEWKLKIGMYWKVYFSFAQLTGYKIPKSFIEYKWGEYFVKLSDWKKVKVNVKQCDENRCLVESEELKEWIVILK